MLKPLATDKWNFATAAHLLNRAGFGGTPAEINHLAALGGEQAVEQLVDYHRVPDPTPDPEWAKPDPERWERVRAIRQAPPDQRKELQRKEQRTQQVHLLELRQWWLERMAKGPRPLQEKLVLFWHGHFATSAQKVRDTYFMWRQNDTFRRLGDGNWRELLTAVAKDPAMLVWLDQAQSRKEHPNENFAREVMELFALGEGHYSEKDIGEAARALTGWTLNRVREEFEYRWAIHDTGIKTVLGRTGNLTGTDVMNEIAAQPQSARFITAKVWNFFAGEPPSEALTTALADEFRRGGSNFKPLLRMMFRSEEFYSPTVVNNEVKSPVQIMVNTVRTLERDLPPPFLATNLLRLLGQDLFAPPNVKGWDGGINWITTNNLLNRYNLAAVLVLGRNAVPMVADRPGMAMMMEMGQLAGGPYGPAEVAKLFNPEERSDRDALVAAMEKRFLQAPLKASQRETITEYLAKQETLGDSEIRHAIRLLMSTPEFQLT